MPAYFIDVHLCRPTGQLADAGFPAAEHWKIYLATMVIAFAAVVPFIIYAEVKRRMKQVFLFCVGLIIVAEIVLLGSGASISGNW
ncbi:major facilitator family transport protein [Salmonella bongori]|nr:major facilitator family transport protein [Salmonella bongori]